MTVYAPDSDFFIHVQRLGFVTQVQACGQLPIAVTDVVWGELVAGTNAYANAAISGLLTTVAVAPRVLQPQTPEAATFMALQAPPKTEDPGEHSIIAVALHDPNVVPVLLDKKGLHRAVEELRRPVLSMHGFLDVLVRGGHLPGPLARDFATAYRRGTSAAKPQWW